MNNDYITIEGVFKIIRGIKILQNINATFERGMIHGLIGRNGSGKSMLLKMICGLTPPSTGRVIIDKMELGKDIDFPGKLSCLIESPGFLAGETGYTNLYYLKSMTVKPDKSKLVEVLRLVGLERDMYKKVGRYSTGMKQRLGMAQVLMDKEESDLFILDEPFTALDDEIIATFRGILLDLKRDGKTIIISTHMPDDIETLCDTVSEMQSGAYKRQDSSE